MSSARKPRGISASRTTITYTYTFQGAKFFLEEAMRKKDGGFYNCMAAITFCAFTLEAYLTHVGKALAIEPWDDFVWQNPKEKLEAVCSRIDCQPDMGRVPFCSFGTIFAIRKEIVHGKTETIESHREKYPEPNWALKCKDNKWAKQLVRHTREMVRTLHETAGFGKYPFASLGQGSYWEEKSEDRKA